MSPPTVAVLAYHKIGRPPVDGWETWYYVTEQALAAHLALLRGAGWPVIDLATLLRGLDDPAALPPRSAVVSFDDGYRSLRTVALPVLAAFSCPAVVFVPTGFVGGSNSFDSGVEPTEPMCDWDDLRRLAAAEVTIGSHGVSHQGFGELPAPRVRAEIRSSRELLADRLGQPVDVLAYPFGDGGPDPKAMARDLAAAGYRAAFQYKGGPLRVPVPDRYQLARVPVGADTDLAAELGIGGG